MRAFFPRRGVAVLANWMGKLKTFFQITALGTRCSSHGSTHAIDRGFQPVVGS